MADIKKTVFPKRNGTYSKYSDDILGTAALPVRRTPLDRKWNYVSAAKTRSQTALREYMAAAGISRHGNKRQLIHRVNNWVNAAITYTDDIRMTGTRDSWAPALQTLRSGRGDCEDYAIGKMQLLMAAGIREQDMQFVVVRDLVRRADHAILIVKLDGEMLLLDSNTNRIVDARQNHDYMPVFSFSGSKKWMHGRRYQPKVSTTPVQLASR
ncbi:transglutaminase-like cysteine peptidase [Sphingorhabdus sp. Alg239-R122]|uniref:transglutaminase-like cysteine peptidase n=1 Tax=Sphingorhabdus sp. Alg239-R122 TaxID=2305989 RepID=UPI0013DC9CC7|nr:transglutaminase-like cysteine peptidase [Sphingorhabdus sp. Alg239-R122]